MKKVTLLLILAIGFFTACQSDTQTAEGDVIASNKNVNTSPAKTDKNTKTDDAPKAEKVALKTGYKIGDTAEDFKLKNVDGNMVSMADYTDAKGFVVIFTCNHCPYAVKYEDRIIELHNKLADQGYPIIAINPNDPDVQPADSFEKMQTRANEKGFKFPYLFDEGQKVFPKYGATKTPHVFILNKELVVEYIGAIDDNYKSADDVKEPYVLNAIAALNKGEKPNPTETKAIGCSIKCKK